mgnify:CR=1 FL=1
MCIRPRRLRFRGQVIFLSGSPAPLPAALLTGRRHMVHHHFPPYHYKRIGRRTVRLCARFVFFCPFSPFFRTELSACMFICADSLGRSAFESRDTATLSLRYAEPRVSFHLSFARFLLLLHAKRADLPVSAAASIFLLRRGPLRRRAGCSRARAAWRRIFPAGN